MHLRRGFLCCLALSAATAAGLARVGRVEAGPLGEVTLGAAVPDDDVEVYKETLPIPAWVSLPLSLPSKGFPIPLSLGFI